MVKCKKVAAPGHYWLLPRIGEGKTIAIFASGPSLTAADVNYVRGKVDCTIAINTTYRIAPWADVLYAADAKWWRWHSGAPDFHGLKLTVSRAATVYPGVRLLQKGRLEGLEKDPSAIATGANSGYQAINVAAHLLRSETSPKIGAGRIILLGYDMGPGARGESHHHGDHPDHSRPPFATFLRLFPSIVAPLAARQIEVINCTPRTRLHVFPKMELAAALPAKAEAISA